MIRPHVVNFRCERWQTADGAMMTAPLPAGISGHFGPQLRRFVLAQYHQAQVTVPRLLALLRGFGIIISKRQIVRLLIAGQDSMSATVFYHSVKTRLAHKLTIPVLPELQTILQATANEHLTFLVTEFGKPFTAAGFGNWFRDVCNEARLPRGLSPHGLRKAAANALQITAPQRTS